MTYTKKAVLIVAALVVLLTLGWTQKVQSDREPTGEILATSTEAVQATPELAPEELEPEVALRTYPTDSARREASEASYAMLKAGGSTEDREVWLMALEWCESRGLPGAINPVDRDGTPSNGLLQFKDTTFAFFSKAYGIPGEMMDPEAQRAIVRRMMDDPSIKWQNQFPDCVQRHIGWPPGVLQ